MSEAAPGGLRDLPSVDSLAGHPALCRLDAPPGLRARAAREVLAAERAGRRQGRTEAAGPEALGAAAAAWLERRLSPGPRRVVNAAGVVLHTNLGRAPLSAAARAALLEAAGYTDLELDLAGGGRGSRQDHLAPLLATLCGTEDALVVTNNAAGVLLALSALCRGGEVLVSRGEAVEIGGGFRIPEVLRLSGARLVDVGTTNRTRAADYEAALTPRSRALLRVHPSNFSQSGFVERPTTAQLAAVARRHHLLLLEDAGSGALVDPATLDPGLAGEPVLPEVTAAGADLVLASADKLCGGPQAGLVAGRAELVARLRRHPLMRALRPDKLVLAALGATLAAWLRGEAAQTIPVARMLARDAAELAVAAAAWRAELDARGVPGEVAAGLSAPGGGTLPAARQATACVVLPGPAAPLSAALRRGRPPVLARVEHGRVWLDPRTVAPEEGEELLAAVVAAWAAVHGDDPGRQR